MAHAKGHTVARSIHSTAHTHGSYTAHTQITQHTAYTHCIYTLHIPHGTYIRQVYDIQGTRTHCTCTSDACHRERRPGPYWQGTRWFRIFRAHSYTLPLPAHIHKKLKWVMKSTISKNFHTATPNVCTPNQINQPESEEPPAVRLVSAQVSHRIRSET